VQATLQNLVASFQALVMVHDPYLQWLPDHSSYQKVGPTNEHPTNHYGTFNAIYRIQQICMAFKAETGVTPGVNDISLPWGGRFDLGPSYGGLWWHGPHGSHMWGRNADIPYQYLGTLQQRERFRQIAVEYEGDPYPESNHFHLRFAY
jgi:murein endopeptidase